MGESPGKLREHVLDSLAPCLRIWGIAKDEVHDDFDLFASGLLDSMVFVDLFADIEQRLGRNLEIEELDFVHLDTFESLIEQLSLLLRNTEMAGAF